jgi:membrane-bound ClpP family serine protease
MAATGIASAAAVYWAFHSSLWKKLQVQSSIDGKANIISEEIKIGDPGRTISRLNPTGKAFIKDQQVEVQALEGFIDQEKEITVAKLQQNKIFVKLK